MHVSGLVLAIRPGADLDAIAAAVSGIPGCAVDRRVGSRLVVVSEAPDVAAAVAAHERILGVAGVLAADVAFATVVGDGACASAPDAADRRVRGPA